MAVSWGQALGPVRNGHGRGQTPDGSATATAGGQTPGPVRHSDVIRAHLLGLPVDLRGRPAIPTCSSAGEPTTSKTTSPRVSNPYCGRRVADRNPAGADTPSADAYVLPDLRRRESATGSSAKSRAGPGIAARRNSARVSPRARRRASPSRSDEGSSRCRATYSSSWISRRSRAAADGQRAAQRADPAAQRPVRLPAHSRPDTPQGPGLRIF